LFEGASNSTSYPYATHVNVLFPALEQIDGQALVAHCTHRWYKQALCQVNGSVVGVGGLQRQYHWHKHDQDDEFFFVIDGQLLVDLEAVLSRSERVTDSLYQKTFLIGPVPRSKRSFSWAKTQTLRRPETSPCTTSLTSAIRFTTA
jgi:hypothetical protein